MSKSLKRLLTLRERLKKAAESHLHASHDARAREADCAANNQPANHLGTMDAGALLHMQERQEASLLRLARIDQVVAERSLLLTQAKREHRQIEKLVDAHAQRRSDGQLRQELAEQEDWVRAKAHGGSDK